MGDVEKYFTKTLAEATAPSPPPIPAPPDYFDFALAYLGPNEGGYANVPGDPGGPTNFGITQATLARWRKVSVTAEDVQNLTLDEASDIYRKWFWADFNFDKISNRAIATCLFDQGVLAGQKTAIRYAQLAVNNSGAMIAVDGDLEDETLGALDAVNTNAFLRAYVSILKAHYEAIVQSDASKAKFLKGWVSRCDRLITLT